MVCSCRRGWKHQIQNEVMIEDIRIVCSTAGLAVLVVGYRSWCASGWVVYVHLNGTHGRAVIGRLVELNEYKLRFLVESFDGPACASLKAFRVREMGTEPYFKHHSDQSDGDGY